MLRRTTRNAIAVAAVVALAATGCGGSEDDAAQDGPVTITVGAATTASSIPVVLGIEQGIFEREGINLEQAFSGTGAGAISQLINGEVTVALGGISGVVTANASNIEVQMVTGGVADHEVDGEGQYQTLVAADSGIESFSDLEGKTVAVNSLECCWEFWTRESVREDGGDQASLNMTQIPFPDQVTALREGRVDAVTTLQPFVTQLLEDGFVSLGDPAAIAHDNPENGNTNYFMARSFIEENPDAVDAWYRALAAAAEYANNHPEETRAAIVEVTGSDPELIDRAPLPFYTAEIDRQTVENEARFLVDYGVIEEAPPYEDLVWDGARER